MDTERIPVYGECILEQDYAGLVRDFPLDPAVRSIRSQRLRSYVGSSRERETERQKVVLFRLRGEGIGGFLMKPYHQQRYEGIDMLDQDLQKLPRCR